MRGLSPGRSGRPHARAVEQVCFRLPLVLRAKATGQNPVYYLLGEIDAGCPLFCVVIEFPGGKAYPVTARDMTTKEKRRYGTCKKR